MKNKHLTLSDRNDIQMLRKLMLNAKKQLMQQPLMSLLKQMLLILRQAVLLLHKTM
ncbi:hypothetical protein HO565_09290 [Streptococcus suis]|nr:hypothetical protein [Streptococcus suis]